MATQVIGKPAPPPRVVAAEKSTLGAAISKIARHIQRTGKLQMDAVRELWPKLGLTKSDIEYLAQMGLQDRVSDALHGRIGVMPESGDEIRFDIQVSRSVSPTAYAVEIVFGVGEFYPVGGANKRIMEFTVDDCRELSASLSAQANSLLSKISTLAMASREMSSRGAKTIGELPADVKASLGIGI